MSVANTPSMKEEYPYGKIYAHYVLFLLFSLFLFDFLDRSVITTLFGAIKLEWNLTDKQLGMLMSIVNLALAILAIPTAVLIDYWNKKNMVAIMGLVWGLASLACAFAPSFGILLILRFIIGAGEAGYNPGANAILKCYFPPRKLNGILGFMQSGASFGVVAGMFLGGFIVAHWSWRHALGVVAVPGLILAVLVFFIKEPMRQVMTQSSATQNRPPFLVACKQMFSNPAMLCVYVAVACGLLFTQCLTSWMPSYYARMEGIGPQAAASKAAMLLILKAVGAILGGVIADRAAKRWVNGHLICAGIYMICFAAIFSLGFKFVSNENSFIVMALGSLFAGSMFGPTYNTVMQLSPKGCEATAIGFQIIIQNLFGMGLSGILSGTLSDHYKALYMNGTYKIDEAVLHVNGGNIEFASVAMGLKSALAAMSLAPLLAAVLYFIAAHYYRKYYSVKNPA